MIFKSKIIENNFSLNTNETIIEKSICLIKKEKNLLSKENEFSIEKINKEKFLIKDLKIKNKESKFLIRVLNLIEQFKHLELLKSIYINNKNNIESNNNIEIKNCKINKKELLYNSLFCLNNKNKNIEKINFISLFKNKNIFELNNSFKIKNKKNNFVLLKEKKFNYIIDLEIKNLNIQIFNDYILINFDKLEFFNEYEIYYYENNDFVFLESFRFEKNKIIKTDKKIFSIIPKGVY